jgi:hypothetical protein
MSGSAQEEDAPWYDRSWTRRISIWLSHKMVGGSADLVDFPKYFAWTSPGFRAAQESARRSPLFNPGTQV